MGIISKTELKEIIRKAWKDGVLKDYEYGNLYWGEQCIHSSLSCHLKKLLNEKSGEFHVWHEVALNMISDIHANDKRRVDLVIVRINSNTLLEKKKGRKYPRNWKDIEKDVEFLVAIEIKYAVDYYTEDFEKLRFLQKSCDEILPVFAYVSGTGWKSKDLESHMDTIRKEAVKSGIAVLHGDTNNYDNWDFKS